MRTPSALQEIERQQHLATNTHGVYSAIFPQARPRVVSYNVPKKNWIYYPNINRSYIIDKTYNPRIKTASDYYMPHRDIPREAPHHPLSAPAGKPRVTKATYPAYAAHHKYIGQGRLEMDWNTSYTMAFNKPEDWYPLRFTPVVHRDKIRRLGNNTPNVVPVLRTHRPLLGTSKSSSTNTATRTSIARGPSNPAKTTGGSQASRTYKTASHSGTERGSARLGAMATGSEQGIPTVA